MWRSNRNRISNSSINIGIFEHGKLHCTCVVTCLKCVAKKNALGSQQNKTENGKIKEINYTDWS